MIVAILFGILFALVTAIVLALIVAPLLMLVARLVGDSKPGYFDAYVAMFLTFVAVGIVRFLIDMIGIEAEEGSGTSIGLSLVSLVAGFLVMSYVLSSQLEMTFRRAMLTSLVMSVLMFGILLAFTAVILAAGLSVG